MTDGHQGEPAPQWPGAAPQSPAPASSAAPYAPPPPTTPPAAPGAPGMHSPQQPPSLPTFRSWQPGIIPLRPLSFGDFLAVPFKAMRFARPTVLGAPLLFTLVTMVLASAMMWVMFSDASLGLLDPYATPDLWTGRTVALGIITLVASLAAELLAAAFIAPGVARAVLGEKLSIGQAWPLVRRRLGSLIILLVLVSAAMVAAFAVALAPFLLLLTGLSALGVVGVVLGVLLMLALIPVFFALVLAQGLVRAIIVLENVSIGTALRRLPTLMRGRIWWSILIAFVATLLIGIATTIMQYAIQFGFLILTLIAPESETVILIAFTAGFAVMFTITAVLTYAYLGTVYTLLYIDARMRHEGFDMDLAQAAEARSAQRR